METWQQTNIRQCVERAEAGEGVLAFVRKLLAANSYDPSKLTKVVQASCDLAEIVGTLRRLIPKLELSEVMGIPASESVIGMGADDLKAQSQEARLETARRLRALEEMSNSSQIS